MHKPVSVRWRSRPVPSRPPAPPPPPRDAIRVHKTKIDKPTSEYNVGNVRVMCWNKTPLDKFVNLSFDDILRDELAADSKGKETKS